MDYMNATMTFTGKLLKWYDENKRDLPWRRTKDPYLIWLSEIILQQTRIEQGLPYYEKFATAFPDVRSLSSASETEILKYWQGLGYYSRARNLLEAAHQVMIRFNGKFPSTYAEIRNLRGVGDYTAAAISSIAFQLPYPVVDGNVLRFLSRYFGEEAPIGSAKAKKQIRERALNAMDVEDPGSFNQAMMEFGARYCIPVRPDCKNCVFLSGCFAYNHQVVDQIPVKDKQVLKRIRYFHYLVMRKSDGQRVLMKKRIENDIWKGLYDFPMIETNQPVIFKRLVNIPEWKALTASHSGAGVRKSGVFRHLLTHQVILAQFYEWTTDADLFTHETWISIYDMKNLPVPKLIDNYFHTLDWFV
ncbi:MAG: A/G-specific adenine glycosylase [Bacteroidales bacterium]|nr:A/G-specific adenine glycosylase [Bacteroidales bacterium]